MSDPAALYSRWLRPGDLVFDIGANVGLRTSVFLEMGLSVVAVEPQPECVAQIDRRAGVLPFAVGAERGAAMMRCSSDYNYLSSLSPAYIEATKDQWPANYDHDLPVLIVTLDWLVEGFGVPAFCKIDVEGYEVEVFKGLTHRLPALSFEVHSVQPDKTAACLDLLAELGDYRLSYSDRESFDLEPWPAHVGLFGDIYAELA